MQSRLIFLKPCVPVHLRKPSYILCEKYSNNVGIELALPCRDCNIVLETTGANNRKR
jgi:hypothetical protein